MPQRSKGARLYLDPVERVWVIRDGTRKRRTGCGEDDRGGAEEKLGEWIAEKYEPVSDHRPTHVLVADVLTFYSREIAPSQRSKATTAYSIDRLLDWWAARPLSDVKRSTCSEYVAARTRQPPRQAKTETAKKRRVSAETARRELTVLRAAIYAYHKEHRLDAMPIVSLPEASAPRQRWLTRDEAASLLRAARAHPDRHAGKALARFILVGLYTGTRSGAIRALSWMPSVSGGWIDAERGLMYRRGSGESESTKRRPPARIPVRLLGHLRRWRKQDGSIARVVHYGGLPVLRQRRAWDYARIEAGLGKEVVPHVLRHTAPTWAMQQGEDLWDASGFFGMSPEILWRVYGHHHPDFQAGIAHRLGRR